MSRVNTTRWPPSCRSRFLKTMVPACMFTPAFGKIIPICFSTFEIFINKLTDTTKDFYKTQDIVDLFTYFREFVDDESVLRYFVEKLFADDEKLVSEIQEAEENRHEKVVKELVTGFKQLENKLREHRVALTTQAIMNVIYLVFIKFIS